MEIVAQIFIIIYYVLSLSQSIPCIIKLVQTKRSNDYSLINRALQYAALLCFTVYLTITETDWTIKIIGYIDVLALTTENILILKYYKRKD